MQLDKIIIRGAREHNLKNINVDIPRDKLTVITGLSGSGKSSLAFDTIYADGQRRYVESLSSYARMFLGQMQKPDVDLIEGLSPAISIDQKTTSKNPRSTVGTVTEIHDYLRLLFARVGTPHCPICGREVKRQTIDEIVEKVLAFGNDTRIQILSPVLRGKKGTGQKELSSASKSGFVRARVDGSIYDLSEKIELDKNFKHTIEIIVDRLVITHDDEDFRSRLTDSIETAATITGGLITILTDETEIMFSQRFSCHEHEEIAFDELSPRMFSFNNPFGACPKCTGLGMFLKIDPALIVPDENKSIREGAIHASGWQFGRGATIANSYFEGLAEKYKFSLDTPYKELPDKVKNLILYGTGNDKIRCVHPMQGGVRDYETVFEGVVNNMERRYSESASEWSKEDIRRYMTSVSCPDCHGKRLSPTSLAVTVDGRNISEISDLSIVKAAECVTSLYDALTPVQLAIGQGILKEITERLSFLVNVGLPYLTLSRSAGTLSGGESQRIRLATQIGSSLCGVLYILDEPSIGLHQSDTQKLVDALKRLRDLGNTVIVVEHDEETMLAADYIIDVGPGAGVHGGEIVSVGTPAEVSADEKSLTGQYLSGKKSIAVPAKTREGNGKFLQVVGASENNLKDIDVKIPLGAFTVVTGVSGSGKSTLVNEIIYKKLAVELNRSKEHPGAHREFHGAEHLDSVVDIDQSPIGRTPRSNPATYTGVFTDIRELFSLTQDAKMRGYSTGRFSFNVKGGRCEACQGDGQIKIEMHFLPDIYVPCEVCKGKRYGRETLEVKYKGKNIYEVLEMTIEEAYSFFKNVPKIERKIKTLVDVGLGYIKLGQSSTTLSGGEAQRIKLASELSRRGTGKTIYILDEPTTGLHTHDVKKLIDILQKLTDTGNTVLVIEHNRDVIKCADFEITLGPGGGDEGGNVLG